MAAKSVEDLHCENVNITKDTALTEKGRDGQRSRGQREYARQNLAQAGARRPTGPSHIQVKDQTSFL